MNEVALTTYAIAAETTPITEVNSVPLPDGRHPPKDLFTALYGARDTLIHLQDAHINAKQRGLVVHRADLKVQAGRDSTSKVNSELAKNAVYINLERLEANLEAALIQYIAPSAAENSLSAIIDNDPDLLHKLFDCPVLPEVNVITWPATYKDDKTLQVATVKDLSQITIKNTTNSFSENLTLAY